MKTALEILEEKTHHYQTKVAIPKKLYRQDQVLIAMEKYADQFKVKNLAQPDVSGSLPTDKEIETWATYECGGCSQESNDERIGLIRGAKWMRRQILKAQGNDR